MVITHENFITSDYNVSLRAKSDACVELRLRLRIFYLYPKNGVEVFV